MGKDNVHVQVGNSVGEMRNASARSEQVADTSVPAIEMVDLCKSFGKFQAVDHLSLIVQQGEIFGLLGPNGSGKTTTINMVSGLSVPTSGKVRVMGVDVQSRRAIWDYILSLRDQGKTVLITTNYLEEAQALCERIAIIDHGKLIAVDTPDHLKQTYGGSVIELETATPSASVDAIDALEGVKQVKQDGTYLTITTQGITNVVPQTSTSSPRKARYAI